MNKKWTIASTVMVILTVVNLLPIDELAKITRILPDNLFSDRAEIQMIDQEIRRIIRRNARSDEKTLGEAESIERSTHNDSRDQAIHTNIVMNDLQLIKIQKYLHHAQE